MKECSHEQMVAEKAISYGSMLLSDVELLAFMANIPMNTARELFFKVLPGNKKLISSMELQEFTVVKGIGMKTAARIKAALDFGRRLSQEDLSVIRRITSSKDIFQVMHQYLMGEQVESFYVIYLARGNRILKIEKISQGGTTGTVVDAKVLFKKALLNNAQSVVLVHNHPSGLTAPSAQDSVLTERLVKVGKALDLAVLDHVIYSDQGYFSFADEGVL